ncbi:MAG TPA: NAD(P)-dependent oxidoreductase [Tepidisphaeraceae bacterium]|nr:NAD(P)-dependent oxidoreductase [Tepidisphaeraceae bacterium]
MQLDSLKPLRGKTALVTGAGGFIGARLCGLLRENGVRVLGTTRSEAQLDCVDETISLDLAQPAEVRAVFERNRFDVIFHLAGATSAARSIEQVAPTFLANLASTVWLLEAAAKHQCERIVLAGSQEDPQAASGGRVVPSSPYSASKHAAAAYGLMFHQTFSVPVVLARIFMVYGPGQRDLRKLIPYVTTSLLRHESPRLTSGRRAVDWVYVDDVARDLALAAAVPGLAGKTIDIGTGVLTPVRAVARRLGEMMNSRVKPIFGELADRADEQEFAADTASRHRLLGDAPVTPLDVGLRHTIEWYTQTAKTRPSG